MKSRTRLYLSIGIPVVIVLLVIGLLVFHSINTNDTATTQTTAGSKTSNQKLTPFKVALDFTPNPNHTGIYTALAKGWYKQQGIDVSILPFSQNAFPDVLVASGKADVGISGTESIVLDDASNQNVVSIATITQHNTSYLVTRADALINSPKDLDGKIYGSYGAPYEIPIMSKVIQHAGGKGKFRTITLGTDAISALRSKQIDFAWVFNLDIVGAEHQGLQLKKFAVTDYGVPDYYSPTIVTSKDEIQKNSDLLKRFMQATTQGYEFAKDHPDEAAQLLINTAPKGTFPDNKLVIASQESLSPLYTDGTQKWGFQSDAAWNGYLNFILPTGSVQDQKGKVVEAKNLPASALYTNQFIQ
ncbi:ABC transporter substrate-binding protein [Dictyobacter kobayashii]|uniref:ABC transporter substrate-binding protein n=1 Tax=Dictyobacter kobayashii TaxID=2014872 RepID=A0A402AV97_9CHLR|nr:ABC transporter substrate-binding protein [Dictyobacter kobayashii]GCE23038.1 ABC transporter substrate-binding protein [Dictyobacter kobayashii]